jgi:hypothetical protein
VRFIPQQKLLERDFGKRSSNLNMEWKIRYYKENGIFQRKYGFFAEKGRNETQAVCSLVETTWKLKSVLSDTGEGYKIIPFSKVIVQALYIKYGRLQHKNTNSETFGGDKPKL